MIRNRVVTLLISTLAGGALAWLGYKFLFNWLGWDDDPRLKSSVTLLLLGLPTLGYLWFFRTQDVRENIHQNELFDALKAMMDKQVVAREVATLRLMELSKKVPEYNEQIEMAFIKVLMSFPAGDEEVESGLMRTYAAPILSWLKEQGVEGENTDVLILDMQDFSRDRDENNRNIIELCDFMGYDRVSFRGTNLAGVDLRYAGLLGADLLRTNLQGADLQGANLLNSDLIDAKLERATYDDSTKFSDGFDPGAYGMVKKINEDEQK